MSSQMNKFALQLSSDIRSRFAVDASGMPNSEWICRNTTLRGLPFSFRKFPFQKVIVDDMHPNLSVKKISQVGLSEVQIRKAAAIVTRNRGRTLLFTFPNEDMQKKTSQTRIQPLITENDVFNKEKAQGVPQSRSVGIIQIGSSFLMINSCTEGEATSTPADAVFNDEVDLSDPAILALYASRMQASDWKIRQQFSTPTFSGFGIDQSYETSDQHEYFVKCDGCNHWQIPLYDKKFVRIPGLPTDLDLTDIDQHVLDKHKIDLTQSYVACERCGSELDLARADNRNWVPRHPHRTLSRGYHVRPFSVGTLSVAYIVSSYLEYLKKGFLRGWYNTVLGETYQDGDIRLTDVQIEACFGDASTMTPTIPAFGTPCFIGIDIGLTCHIVILAPNNSLSPSLQNMRAILFMAIPVEKLFETVATLRRQYLIVYGTVDRHPYTPTANDLFTETNGIIVPVEYRGHAEVRDKIETDGCLQANRTDLLDLVAVSIRKQRLLITGYGTQKETIKTHLKDMVREESPEKPAVWKKLGGNDHYFHALAYAYLAVKVFTGDYTGSEASREVRSTVFIGGVGSAESATATLSRMIGGGVSKGGMGRISRLG